MAKFKVGQKVTTVNDIGSATTDRFFPGTTGYVTHIDTKEQFQQSGRTHVDYDIYTFSDTIEGGMFGAICEEEDLEESE